MEERPEDSGVTFTVCVAILFLVSLLLMCFGCEKQRPTVEVKLKNAVPEDQPLTVTNLGTNDRGYWRLVELKYEGRRYIYLQHYDSNNQTIVQVKDEPLKRSD